MTRRRSACPAILLSALFLLAVTYAAPSGAQDRHATQRARMVAEIAAMARETGGATGRPNSQYLLLVDKRPDGTVTTKRTLPVRFVPFTRERGTK